MERVILIICVLVASGVSLHQQSPLFQDAPNSDDVSSLINSIQNGSPKSRIFYDYQTRIVAYKDLIKSRCLLEFLRSSETLIKQNLTDTNSIAKDFFVSDRPLSKRQIWMIAGQRLYEFCRGFPTYLVQEMNLSNLHTINNDIVDEENFPNRKTITKRDTKHFFTGRVRGQTQSQYLNYGNSKDPGKAEAESSYGSSKAAVTGNSGMGQAQSQSSPVGCDDCYGGEVDQFRHPSYPAGPGEQITTAGFPGQIRRPGLPEGGIQTHLPSHTGQILSPGSIQGRPTSPGYPGQTQIPGQLVYPGGQIPGHVAYIPQQPGYAGTPVQGTQVFGPQHPAVQIGGQQPSGAPGQLIQPAYPGQQVPTHIPVGQGPGVPGQLVGYPGVQSPGQSGLTGTQLPVHTGGAGTQIPGTQFPGQIPNKPQYPVGPGVAQVPGQFLYPNGATDQVSTKPSQMTFPVQPGAGQYPGQQIIDQQHHRPLGGKFAGQFSGDYNRETDQGGKFSGRFSGDYTTYQNGRATDTAGELSRVSSAPRPDVSGYIPSAAQQGVRYPTYPGYTYEPAGTPIVSQPSAYIPPSQPGQISSGRGGQIMLSPGVYSIDNGQQGYVTGTGQPGYGAQGGTSHTGYTSGSTGQQGFIPGVGAPGQPGYVSGGTVGQPGYISGGAPGQPGYIPAGAPGQPGYIPAGASGQPGYIPAGASGQPGYISAGAPAQSGYISPGALGQPGYISAATPGQPGYTSAGAPGQPGYTSAGAPGHPGYISAGAPGQPGYISGGAPGQTGYISGGATGQPGYVAGGQPNYSTGAVAQPGYASGQGTQAGYGPQQPGYALGPGGQVITASGKPSEYVNLPGAVQGGYYDEYGRFVSTTGGQVDDSDSQAETSVQQSNNETEASALAQGKYGGGTAQSQVSGTYSGSGAFSASAGSDDGFRGSMTQVSGGKEGAQSSAQGKGGLGQSQAQVQLNSDTGDTISNAQSGGLNHGTQTQVQASGKGGMADAQANGPGSTSSQAQIGFSPYDEQDIDDQETPFRGGGMASAQSSGLSGQTQSQIQGKFHHGIKYIGAAQAGSGNMQTGANNQTKPSRLSAFKPINFKPSQSQTQQVSNTQSTSSRSSKSFQMAQNQPRPLTQQTNNDESEPPKHTPKHIPTAVETTSENVQQMNATVAPEINKDEDDYNDENAYDDYDTDDQTRTDKPIITQNNKHQQQQIALDPLEDLDATVQQSYGDIPADGTVLQPGESVPGTPGYQIPQGFRGRVKSMSSGRNAYTSGKNSQAQTVTLTPGSGRVIYKRPVVYSVGSRTHNINGRYGYGSGYSYQPVRYQLKSGTSLPNFISMSKSETGSRNLYTGKKTPSVYYTQSSTCGVFTNTCVFNASGRVCFPKPKTNPDGTLMGC